MEKVVIDQIPKAWVKIRMQMQAKAKRNYKKRGICKFFVGGFFEDTDADEVISTIEDFLKEGKRREKAVKDIMGGNWVGLAFLLGFLG